MLTLLSTLTLSEQDNRQREIADRHPQSLGSANRLPSDWAVPTLCVQERFSVEIVSDRSVAQWQNVGLYAVAFVGVTESCFELTLMHFTVCLHQGETVSKQKLWSAPPAERSAIFVLYWCLSRWSLPLSVFTLSLHSTSQFGNFLAQNRQNRRPHLPVWLSSLILTQGITISTSLAAKRKRAPEWLNTWQSKWQCSVHFDRCQGNLVALVTNRFASLSTQRSHPIEQTIGQLAIGNWIDFQPTQCSISVTLWSDAVRESA